MNSGAIMTMPIRIDTLKYAQLLKESGLPAEQAELQAEALGTVLNECQVAVESDLVIQRSDLLARMDLLKQEIYDRMDLLKQEIYSRIDALELRIDTLERRVAGLETKLYLFFGIQFLVDAAILFKLFS
jgi:hypothetical protein